MNTKGQQADALNPAIAPQLAIGDHGRGVSDPFRWTMERVLCFERDHAPGFGAVL
jgi:hypothetical protein